LDSMNVLNEIVLKMRANCVSGEKEEVRYDTYAILNITGEFSNWTLKSFNIPETSKLVRK
jgi:hypothetical protein